MVPTILKYPEEVFAVSVDFSNVLQTGETLDLQTSAATAENLEGEDTTAEVIKSGSLTNSGAILIATVNAGSQGDLHKLKFTAGTSLGNIWVFYAQLQLVGFNLED